MDTTTSSSTTPILVLGDKRRHALTSHLSNCVNLWLRTWVASGREPQFVVTLSAATEAAIKAEDSHTDKIVTGCVEKLEHLAAIADGDALAAVLDIPRHAWSGGSSKDGIAGGVFDKLLTALARGIVADLKFGPWQIGIFEQHLSRKTKLQDFKRGWIATIAFEDRPPNLQVAFSATLVSHLIPVDSKAVAATLTRRRAAIAEEPMRIEAVLGEASVSIGDLASLAINDVIVLRDDSPQAGYVTTTDGRRVANMSLGRVGAKRAALITK